MTPLKSSTQRLRLAFVTAIDVVIAADPTRTQELIDGDMLETYGREFVCGASTRLNTISFVA
jgi:hypothetical protein